jgi:TRAP-type C4-dicarboxylate transport system permease small subunit
MPPALRSWSDRLIGLAAIAGGVAVFGEVAVILTDVVGRQFGRPLAGARDLSQMLMVLVVFGGMALCARRGGHIVVDVFERSFPPWLNRLTDVVGAAAGAVIFLAIAWALFEAARVSQMLNLATNVIGLPRAWFQWAIFAFSLVTALALAMRAWILATEERAERDVKEPSL